MNLQIITDASHHPQENVGGWACVVIYGTNIWKYSGPIRSSVSSSHECEIMAIGNAVASVIINDNAKKANKIIIHTDCEGAIIAINNHSISAAKTTFNYILQLMQKTNCIYFDFKHVKAHSNKKDKISMANKWCDNEAKKQMRSLL